MDPSIFDCIVPHLKICGMDAAAITRARALWETVGEEDGRGLPCPFCTGRGRTGWLQVGFTAHSKGTEAVKCKSCGEVLLLRKP